MIPLFKPFFCQYLASFLQPVFDSGYVGLGPKVEEFEKRLQVLTGSHHVVTLNSCTSALQMALKLAGVGPGDKVLTTPLTFFATTSAILSQQACPAWVDIDPQTLNVDLDDLKAKLADDIRAIVVVHYGGYPVDLDRLKAIVESSGRHIPVIEDCAHALCSSYKREPIGSHGNYCAFSFQATKHLNTVDGGCLVVKDQDEETRAKHLRWFGMDRTARGGVDFRATPDVYEAGYKWHMNDIDATIGLEHSQWLHWLLTKTHRNASFYQEHLGNIPGVNLLEQHLDHLSSYYLFTIKVENRDALIKKLKDHGIASSQVHDRNDRHPCVSAFKTSLPNLEKTIGQILSIPVGWWVSEDDAANVVKCIKSGW